jgi:threonine/homoserine/homoserine lactone efflux protein
MENTGVISFLLAATALLGSPGPGIMSLVAIVRAEGLRQGMRFFLGLQIGLAAAAAASAAGLLSLLRAFPAVLQALHVIATVYLLYLAWCIATAAVGTRFDQRRTPAPIASGLLLGIANPKAYLAFISLLASQSLIANNAAHDGLLKWTLLVAVMAGVDIAWLLVGAGLNQTRLNPAFERAMNMGFGLMVAVTAVMGMS